MKNIFYIVGCFLILSSCEDEISLVTLDSTKAVITGYLYAGQTIDSIRITESTLYSGDGTLNVIDNLNILVSNDLETITLISIGNGYYNYPDHIIEEGLIYTISFEYESDLVSASTYVKPKKEVTLSQNIVALEQIEFDGTFGGGIVRPEQVIVDISWDNSESDYYFTIVENSENNPEYVNGIIEFLEENNASPQRFFRSEPEITDVHSVNSTRELQFFGNYNITVYRLNVEYAALYESIGNSTLSLQEPPTNVKNGLGIFTAVTPHYLNLQVVKK